MSGDLPQSSAQLKTCTEEVDLMKVGIDATKRKIEKLMKDKASLKNHLKITRHNNQVYRKKSEEMTMKIEELEDSLLKSKAELKSGQTGKVLMEKKIEEMGKKNNNLTLKIEEVETERDAEKEIRLQCQEDKLKCATKDLSSQKLILKLKSNHSKTSTELQTLKEDLIITKKELEEYQEELEDEIQKNKNLQTQKLAFAKSLEESKLVAEANKKQNEDCQQKLGDEIGKNNNLQDEKSEIVKRLEEENCKDYARVNGDTDPMVMDPIVKNMRIKNTTFSFDIKDVIRHGDCYQNAKDKARYSNNR